MKTILKTCVVAAALLMGTSVFAQISLGAKAGMNLSRMSSKLSDYDLVSPESVMGIGYRAGVSAEYKLSANLSLLSGLNLSMNHNGVDYKYNVRDRYGTDYGSAVVQERNTPMFLELPIHVAYKLDFKKNMIVFHGGPYVAYGIAGKTKSVVDKSALPSAIQYWIDPTGVHPDGNFFGKKGYKNFDYGVGIGAGYEMGKLVFDLGYNYGLSELAESKYIKSNLQNAYLTVGYKFK